MTTATALCDSRHGVSCRRCGAYLTEPHWSEYFSEERIVLDLWNCARCGHRFETEAPMSAESAPKIQGNIENKILQEIPPPLWAPQEGSPVL